MPVEHGHIDVPWAWQCQLASLVAYTTIPRTTDDDRQWRIFMAGRGGRLVHLRPDNVGSTRAILSLQSDVRGLDRLDREGVVTVLRATFGELGWETPRILAALAGRKCWPASWARHPTTSWQPSPATGVEASPDVQRLVGFAMSRPE